MEGFVKVSETGAMGCGVGQLRAWWEPGAIGDGDHPDMRGSARVPLPHDSEPSTELASHWGRGLQPQGLLEDSRQLCLSHARPKLSHASASRRRCALRDQRAHRPHEASQFARHRHDRLVWAESPTQVPIPRV